jgi:L-ascorbate metabolism protein UlaG (beta-lactamase superfamily)
MISVRYKDAVRLSVTVLCFFAFIHIGCTPQTPKSGNVSPAAESSTVRVTAADIAANIHWYGNAAIKITDGEKILFFDPFKLSFRLGADIVFISHPHFDHLSVPDLKKVATAGTVFVTPRDRTCINTIKKIFGREPITLRPGEQKYIKGIKVEAVPAYNIKTHQGHPKAMGWLGYIVTLDGIRVYHAGDTERIPEMKSFHCDIALLPLGQTYTMNSVAEAAQCALDVGAGIAIPMHYGSYEGTKQDAFRFKELLAGKLEVIIKEKE